MTAGRHLASLLSDLYSLAHTVLLRCLNCKLMKLVANLRLGYLLSACLLATSLAVGPSFADEHEKTCVYVSSYHRGFEWSDHVEAGLRASLSGHCHIVQYDMDTKRRKEPEDIRAAAADALELIHRVEPDVVITSDDNAARYLIVPYLDGTVLPVVFSGINWTVEEYGFPTENVTGMVEVAPIAPLMSAAMEAVPDAKRAVYLSAQTLTESKNFERYLTAAEDVGIELDQLLAITFENWLDAFDEAQDYDFVVMGGIGGIKDWDNRAAAEHAEENTRTLALTTLDWLMPYSSLGYTLIPEELGEWSGTTAAAILNGTSPAKIPIVTNRKWDTWVNETLIHLSGVRVSEDLSNAKHYRP